MLGNCIRKLSKLSPKKDIEKIYDWAIVIPQMILNMHEIAYFRKRYVLSFIIFLRNFRELVKITVWTDICCQHQWLQDTFASIQQRMIGGTV